MGVFNGNLSVASWLLFSLSWGSVLAATTTPNPPSWSSAMAQAESLTKQMTMEELNNMTFGTGATTGAETSSAGCAGSLNAVGRLKIPRICFQDGSHGVHSTDFVNAYAAGVSVGASWNTDLAYQRGLYMGAEFKAKGVHVALGPVVGPLGRTVEGGRNWESFGVDPYLQGQFASSTINGLQQNVIATIKHFIGNEQETDRNPENGNPAISSDIDDTTFHEMYLWPFQDAVRANVGAMMCSYQRLNSTYACESNYSLNAIAKGELAFPGFMLSDWGAQHSGVESAVAGLDIAMPSSSFWDNGQLATSVNNGTLPAARLSNMVNRLLASWIKIIGGPSASFPESGIGIPVDLVAPHPRIDVRNPAAKPTILQGAIEGHVLVKNINNALPLKKPSMLSLFGYDAVVPRVNNPSASSLSFWSYGYDSMNITISTALEVLTGQNVTNFPQSATLGTLTCGGGSGANSNAYISEPFAAILQQAVLDDTAVFNDFISTNPVVDPLSDACLVFINDFASEGLDRTGLADPASDALVESVASQCSNTIVVIHNAGTRLVDAWIENSNVTAVLFAHLPGQTSGQALTNILYGSVSPSGRLPYTVAKQASDYGYALTPCIPQGSGIDDPQCYFLEGQFIDYRHFLQNNITPRYSFGYGLTYSNFSYSGASSRWLVADPPTTPPKPKQIIPGGIASLFTPLANVTATITNIGSYSAAEVAQLYVQFPGETNLRHLRGFSKQNLAPGKSASVTFTLTRRDLSRWNLVTQMWELQNGTYTFHVGPNVLDVPLSATLSR